MNVVIGVNFVPKFLNMKCGLISLLTFISSLVSMTVFSQVTRKKTILFQYGIADAFVNGLYTGEYPVGQLKREGDFGLGAPDLVDGELTMSNGVVYQT
ncbi:MAG TPA: acetolactate decarboxylase, partial [Puia sp.]|nr:acetolactate decarboxylase [Puia sp.]